VNLAFWKRKPINIGHAETTGELDQYSGTWAFVRDWAKEQIQRLREKNDSPNMNDAQTAVIRGKIKAYKELLDLPKERKGILQ
jgi:hypothetical protein